MKFSLTWLKQYLDTEASAAEIAAKLNALGIEAPEAPHASLPVSESSPSPPSSTPLPSSVSPPPRPSRRSIAPEPESRFAAPSPISSTPRRPGAAVPDRSAASASTRR